VFVGSGPTFREIINIVGLIILGNVLVSVFMILARKIFRS